MPEEQEEEPRDIWEELLTSKSLDLYKPGTVQEALSWDEGYVEERTGAYVPNGELDERYHWRTKELDKYCNITTEPVMCNGKLLFFSALVFRQVKTTNNM